MYTIYNNIFYRQKIIGKHVAALSCSESTTDNFMFQELRIVEDDDVIASKENSSTDAEVFVANGDITKDEQSSISSIKAGKSPTKSTTSSSGEEKENDLSKSADDLPIQVVNRQESIVKMFADFTSENKRIRDQHQLVANTRTKQLIQVGSWLSTEDTDQADKVRAWVYVGKNGIGKSCLAAAICDKYSNQLAGYHFFQHNNSSLDLNDPRLVIQWLTRCLCQSVSNYSSTLPAVDTIREVCASGSVAELAETLLFTPLSKSSLEPPPAKQHMVLVIDALDESNHQMWPVFLQALNKMADICPPWLHLAVTTKEDNQVLSHLPNFTVVEMKSTTDQMTDIKRYLREPMSAYMDRISLDGGLTQLAKKAQGSFLCAHLYKAQLDAYPKTYKLAMRDVESLFQTGLIGMLSSIFKDFKNWLVGSSVKEADRLYHCILGVFILAREEISPNFISQCGGSLRGSEVVAELRPVLHISENGSAALRHLAISSWLLNPQVAGDCLVDISVGREHLSKLVQEWIAPALGEEEKPKNPVDPRLAAYALKHGISHLTDVPKQHDQIASMLCSLRYMQEKLKLHDVEVRHLLSDYNHEHYQLETDRTITLSDYLKKQPKIQEQLQCYQYFLQQKQEQLKSCPDFLFHVAANYPTFQRIQQNARVEIGDQPWIEDLTALPETHCATRRLPGQLCSADVSPDGKTLALVTKDAEYNVQLHLLNTQTAQEKVAAVEIKNLPDRLGMLSCFLADSSAVFVGSLTSFVTSRGKVILSGLDTSSVLKEKYCIECASISAKYLVCGLTTLPFNGRSLHLAVFDLKSHKCLKTLEVLRFRFGGSAQFGVKSTSISSNESMVCTCVKQNTKPQLTATVWSTSKWTQLYTATIDNDNISKCCFVGESMLIFGGSIHNRENPLLQTKVWLYKDETATDADTLDALEIGSLFNTSKQKTVCTRWYRTGGSASVHVWDKRTPNQEPSASYTVRGLLQPLELICFGNQVFYLYNDEIRIYDVSDMDPQNTSPQSPGNVNVDDVSVCSVSYLPRSDTALVAHTVLHGLEARCGVSMLGAGMGQEDLSLSATAFTSETYSTEGSQGTHAIFRGSHSSTLSCGCTGDSNTLMLNLGTRVLVWDRAANAVEELPAWERLPERDMAQSDNPAMRAVVSGKDALVGVVYGQLPTHIFLYDLRSRRFAKKLSHTSPVSDLSFMPSTGYVISYHQGDGDALIVWNHRNGQKLHETEMCVTYCRASPASDRLALSTKRTGVLDGEVLLQNSDRRFSSTLKLPASWPAAPTQSDLDFSPDGTIVMGVAAETATCRVWNAGNGEVLRDLKGLGLTGPTEMVGMLTNTHAVLREHQLLVVDVASGDVVARLPVHPSICLNTSPQGLRISPRGNAIVGSSDQGQLWVFQCHNFSAIKRKTTLQRIKSFSKQP